MTLDTLLLTAVVCLLLALLALVVLLRPRPQPLELPAEWQQRLQALAATAQATQLAVARSDGALDAMGQQLRGLGQSVQAAQEALRQAVDERLAQAVAESRTGRAETHSAMAAFEAQLAQRLQALDAASHQTLQALKADIHAQLAVMAVALKDQLDANGQQIRHQFSVLQDALAQQLASLLQGSQHNAEQLRSTLNERLAAIQADNAQQLEQMRRTVDEKLHATLEQRLGESFKLVSDRLEQVHKGLGEMQTLAGSVGDLKRVMTNVKSRGTWGELQLGAIIENVLTLGQYAKNVKTVPGSDELVEFAIRLPGHSDDQPVWLPIDSKYPVEQYQRLMDAHDSADKAAIASAGNAFETSIKLEARKIYGKYVSPPHTTDFAVLYLSTEGLFAEVMRRPGLVEAVQNDCRMMITGPANLAAMLSSLQMGFKTLAIEKRSSEVWNMLAQVKTEFAKFGAVVDATKKSIDAAAKKFDEVGVRTRAIERRLRDVQALPAPGAAPEGSAATQAMLSQEED